MKKTIVLAAVAAAVVLVPSLAHAAATGGGGYPWDTGLLGLEREFTGPVPFMIGMIGMAFGLFGLIHGHDWGRLGNVICYLVIIVSLICAAPTAATALGITGAMVA